MAKEGGGGGGGGGKSKMKENDSNQSLWGSLFVLI